MASDRAPPRHLAHAAVNAAVLAAAPVLSLPPTAVEARVKDDQIVPLLLFKSECKVASLADRSGPSGPLRYVATCENATFFPDGAEVRCPDRDGERSCLVLTQPLRFDKLDLMRRPEPAAPRP